LKWETKENSKEKDMSIDTALENGAKTSVDLDKAESQIRRILNNVLYRILEEINATNGNVLLKSSNDKLRVKILDVGTTYCYLALQAKNKYKWITLAKKEMFINNSKYVFTAYSECVFDPEIMDYAIEIEDVVRQANEIINSKLDVLNKKNYFIEALKDL
jgi:hypothetical protein